MSAAATLKKWISFVKPNGGGETTMRVCETCLKAGQTQIDKLLNSHIEELEGYARDLRGVLGRLAIPTFKEYEQAELAVEDEYVERLREMEPRDYIIDGKFIQPDTVLPIDDDDLPF